MVFPSNTVPSAPLHMHGLHIDPWFGFDQQINKINTTK